MPFEVGGDGKLSRTCTGCSALGMIVERDTVDIHKDGSFSNMIALTILCYRSHALSSSFSQGPNSNFEIFVAPVYSFASDIRYVHRLILLEEKGIDQNRVFQSILNWNAGSRHSWFWQRSREFQHKVYQRFGLNNSQVIAVDRAVNSKEPITLIQGPPGTGKTSTLVAIIASCVRDFWIPKLKILSWLLP